MNEVLFYDLKAGSKPAPSLSSRVTAEVGRDIVTGRYAPGTLLKDEETLSRRYRVSRTVIRDAIKVLVGKGLLEVRRGIGTRVKPRHSWGLLDNDVLAWQLSGPIDSSIQLQLMEIRQVFEPRAARWAASRGTAEDLKNLETACEQMEASVDAIEEFVMADAAFHRAILRASHNEFLSALEGVIYTTLLSSIRTTNPERSANVLSVPLHQEVCEAVRAGDGTLAETRMKLLLDDACKRLLFGISRLSPDDEPAPEAQDDTHQPEA